MFDMFWRKKPKENNFANCLIGSFRGDIDATLYDFFSAGEVERFINFKKMFFKHVDLIGDLVVADMNVSIEQYKKAVNDFVFFGKHEELNRMALASSHVVISGNSHRLLGYSLTDLNDSGSGLCQFVVMISSAICFLRKANGYCFLRKANYETGIDLFDVLSEMFKDARAIVGRAVAIEKRLK